MLTKNEKLQNIIRTLILITLVIPFLLMFTPFTVPILMAVIVAFASEPILKKIKVRTKNRKYFTSGLFLGFLAIFILPMAIFAGRLAEAAKGLSGESLQKSQFFQALFDLWGKAQTFATRTTERFGIEQTFLPQKEELLDKASPFIVEKATALVAVLPDVGLSLFVFFCMLFVLIIHAKDIRAAAMDSGVLPEEEIGMVSGTLQKSCYGVLVSTILIGALQAVIVAAGSQIFGFHEFFLIFTVTFFFSFIPVIGAAPVAVLLSIISFLLGNSGHGIGLIVIAVIAGSIDNILKPYIFSSEEDMSPVLSLLGIIGAIIVFGLPGLLLGPLLLQVTMKLAPYFAKHLWAALK